VRIFLDSGAFSVWNRGEKINLDNYITFCQRYCKDLDAIATLDVIPGEPNKKVLEIQADSAAWEGWANYQKMLKAKIPIEKLIHTFHQGDPENFIEKLVEEGGPYIGVSPANDKTSAQRKEWMDSICIPYILDSKGRARVKFHGFAVTSLKLALAYDWFSVDSSSWRLRGGGYGLIDLPIVPSDLSKKENCYINSIPIGTGVKKHIGNETKGFFDIDKISQSASSFLKKPGYKREIEKLLDEHHFTLTELETDARLRAAWNAIYLMKTIAKFTNIILYLASNEIKSIRTLQRKMQENNLGLENLNVLVSYAMIPKSSRGENILDKLIKMKRLSNV
jgi:Fe-S cluster biosynthesis and repair protein YggX